MDRTRSRYEIPLLQAAIVLALVCRVWLMATQPLADQTEARYGELARVTAEGGYWLMPHLSADEPFLAKPPLATWLAALSWRFLGHNEFCLRLPSLLVSLATAGLLFGWARQFEIGRGGRWMLVASLVSSPIWIVCAGTVMTDATQMLVVTVAMLAAWQTLQTPHDSTGRWSFWTAIGVASLCKGPATLALIGMPLTAYALLCGDAADVIRRLWSGRGLLLATAIALAWYIPAELAHPGFIQYFVIGEHIQRFLEPNWNGDRFGHAHSVPRGTIWLYWAAATCFWFPVMLEEGSLRLRSAESRAKPQVDLWLWCWALTPLLFFTIASNILWTYTLTAIPPFALLVGRWSESAAHWGRRATPALLLMGGIAVSPLCFVWGPNLFDGRSARSLVEAAAHRHPGQPLVFANCFQFSSRFYTRGQAERADTAADQEAALMTPGTLLVMPRESADAARRSGRARPIVEQRDAVLMEVTPPKYASLP